MGSSTQLHSAKTKFSALLTEIQPIVAQFVVWLDEKVAEYKVMGYMNLDSDLGAPKWIKDYSLSLLVSGINTDSQHSPQPPVRDTQRREQSPKTAHHADRNSPVRKKPRPSDNNRLSADDDVQVIEVKEEVTSDQYLQSCSRRLSNSADNFPKNVQSSSRDFQSVLKERAAAMAATAGDISLTEQTGFDMLESFDTNIPTGGEVKTFKHERDADSDHGDNDNDFPHTADDPSTSYYGMSESFDTSTASTSAIDPADTQGMIDPNNDEVGEEMKDLTSEGELGSVEIIVYSGPMVETSSPSSVLDEDKPSLDQSSDPSPSLDESTDPSIEPKMKSQSTSKKNKLHCPSCSFTTAKKFNMQRHIDVKHFSKYFPCKKCPHLKFGDSNQLKNHIEFVHNKSLMCHCHGKHFTSLRGLRLHIANEEGKGKYACQLCDRKFVQKLNFDSHMNLHMGIKPHLCQTCGKSFTYSSSLHAHMVSCTRKLIQQVQRETGDIQGGSGEEVFSCPKCDKVFTSSNSMRGHQSAKHSETAFLCQFCEKTFQWRASRDRHVRLQRCSAKCWT